ncbi:sce7726 family protein [Stenotrophomonas rhizophila]
MEPITDTHVRSALLRTVIAEHVANPNTLVVEEMGLARGACRVDVCVINGHLHGYEIKSDVDNLRRLPLQQKFYSDVLDKATIVVGQRHLTHALEVLPDWWGVRTVWRGSRNALRMDLLRPAKLNPSVKKSAVASLLWRDEICKLVLAKSPDKAALRGNRAALCERLGELYTLAEIRNLVRGQLKRRTDWRGRAQL